MGEEIQEDDSEPAGGEDSPREGGMLKRKDEKAKPRFSKTGESLDINRDDDEERTRTGELLVRNPNKIPWIPRQRSIDHLFSGCVMPPNEEDVYMTLASAKKSEKTMAQAREQMRKQGLYVARERVQLAGNVERAIQRVRARKEHANRLGKSGADGVPSDTAVVTQADPNAFSPEEERYLVPFDPLKERYSRPATRYDPYQAYLQYTMLVPVTNMDSVFGPAHPSRILDVDIRSLMLTDHKFFSEEDLLATELTGLWRKYKYRAEMKWVEFYSQKIDAVRAALDIVVKERELMGGEAGAAGGGKEDAKQGPGTWLLVRSWIWHTCDLVLMSTRLSAICW